jgi:DNA polymerase elongation subunit (family B)
MIGDKMTKAKVLMVDIELAPNIAYVCGKWKQNIGDEMFVSKSFIMCFTAKWLGDPKIIYKENHNGANDKAIIQDLYALLDEADVVVGHNAKDFDLAIVLTRGLVHNLQPPSPYHVVDTLKAARSHFRFLSNKLSSLCEELGLAPKGNHKKFPGFELWKQCLAENEEAWEEMKEYNIQDVISLEALYLRLLPYIGSHPNIDFSDGEELICPKCASNAIQKRGTSTSSVGIIYQRFVCKSCGAWGHDKASTKGGSASRSF